MTEADQGNELEQVTGQVIEGVAAIFGEASPDAVFSRPEQVGEDIVITAAAWERAGGFGFGGGSSTDPGGDSGGGAGGGGGGASQGRPVAIIRISNDRTEIRPIIDMTKLALTV
ncbi:MAG: hypothetical protein V3U47_07235, partial [Acidimicrobiia bacterium]